MRRNGPSLAELMRAGAKMRPAKEALRRVEELRGKLKDLESLGTAKDVLSKLKGDGMVAIMGELYQGWRDERVRLSGELAKLRAKHEKSQAERRTETKFAFDLEAARLRACTLAELRAEANALVGVQEPLEPWRVDLLLGEARSRGLEEVDAVRESLVKSRYAEPWVHTAEGRTLARDLAILSNPKPGDVPIVGTSQSGAETVSLENVEDYFSALEAEEAEGESDE